ncbi:PREDICTED: GON-4-like protein, partial [Thamnophis sirtalis]|uniref:GON-4-like protein n=1 Tax=Thamnophis sirtalis TaxID=35019 RepID=A0A6I9Y202_9SAUR
FADEREGGKKPRRKGVKRQWEGKSSEEDEGGGRGGGRTLDCDLKLDETLDRTLEDGAKQHNLTAVNVRNILHEVITNEHVVAMMKAAISETEDAPVFVSLGAVGREERRGGKQLLHGVCISAEEKIDLADLIIV